MRDSPSSSPVAEASLDGAPPVADWAAEFGEVGYAGPLKVLSAEDCREFLRAAGRERQRPEWSKGHAAVSPVFHRIATHPVLVSALRRLLGENVLLWGASLLVRQPGQTHPWHTDIETADAGN